MIDVMIIAHNEAMNLPHCLIALKGWVRRVFVIDSGSIDGTQSIAERHGAEVVHHDWEGYAQQKNWGLQNLPFESEWVLIVDADEIITPNLRDRLVGIAAKPVERVDQNGFFINRLTYFMGRPVYHCGFFPNWNLRFFKRGKGMYEDREVHEHMIIDDPLGYMNEPMLHHDRRGLEHYIAKHNRYSTLEARSLFNELMGLADESQANLSKESRRRRWLKKHLTTRVPFPGLWRFLYVFGFRLGFLDGRVGFEFSRFLAMYDNMVALKLRELRRSAKVGRQPVDAIAAAPVTAGLARKEGDDPVVPATFSSSAEPDGGRIQMQPEASPWSFKEKVGRAIWMILGKPAFRCSFHNWHRYRVAILRLFGAKVGKGVAIRPSVNIEVPWMMHIEDGVTVGDHAILYSLGPIRIGKRAIISQYAHLCAGTHDYSDHTFKLIRTPVTIGDDVWIGADSFIGPGVTVGPLSVVGARSSAYKPLDAETVYVGNPVHAVKQRVLE